MTPHVHIHRDGPGPRPAAPPVRPAPAAMPGRVPGGPTTDVMRPVPPAALYEEPIGDGTLPTIYPPLAGQAWLSPPDLDNPSQFTCRAGIPVLLECTDEGIDRDKLHLLARNANANASQGNYAMLLVGHTKDDIPEWQQPKCCGYARNFFVGSFAGKAALLAEFCIKNAWVPFAGAYPHRSSELWKGPRPENWHIDHISLLKTSPRFHMGLVTRYDATAQAPLGVQVVRYGRARRGASRRVLVCVGPDCLPCRQAVRPREGFVARSVAGVERFARRPAAGQHSFTWNEEEHPRGQPGNAGEFASRKVAGAVVANPTAPRPAPLVPAEPSVRARTIQRVSAALAQAINDHTVEIGADLVPVTRHPLGSAYSVVEVNLLGEQFPHGRSFHLHGRDITSDDSAQGVTVAPDHPFEDRRAAALARRLVDVLGRKLSRTSVDLVDRHGMPAIRIGLPGGRTVQYEVEDITREQRRRGAITYGRGERDEGRLIRLRRGLEAIGVDAQALERFARRKPAARQGGFAFGDEDAAGPGQQHAPAGGVDIAGKHFTGGEFIPPGDLAEASPHEVKELEQKESRDAAEETREKVEVAKEQAAPTPVKPAPQPLSQGDMAYRVVREPRYSANQRKPSPLRVETGEVKTVGGPHGGFVAMHPNDYRMGIAERDGRRLWHKVGDPAGPKVTEAMLRQHEAGAQHIRSYFGSEETAARMERAVKALRETLAPAPRKVQELAPSPESVAASPPSPGRLFAPPPPEPAPSLTAPRAPVPGMLAVPMPQADEGFALRGGSTRTGNAAQAQGSLFTGGSRVEEEGRQAVARREELPGQTSFLGAPTPEPGQVAVQVAPEPELTPAQRAAREQNDLQVAINRLGDEITKNEPIPGKYRPAENRRRGQRVAELRAQQRSLEARAQELGRIIRGESAPASESGKVAVPVVPSAGVDSIPDDVRDRVRSNLESYVERAQGVRRHRDLALNPMVGGGRRYIDEGRARTRLPADFLRGFLKLARDNGVDGRAALRTILGEAREQVKAREPLLGGDPLGQVRRRVASDPGRKAKALERHARRPILNPEDVVRALLTPSLRRFDHAAAPDDPARGHGHPCGIGPGGFQTGNTCASLRGASSSAKGGAARNLVGAPVSGKAARTPSSWEGFVQQMESQRKGKAKGDSKAKVAAPVAAPVAGPVRSQVAGAGPGGKIRRIDPTDMGRFDGDLTAFSDHVRQAVRDHVQAGGKAVLYYDGSRRELDENFRDAQGNPWGPGILAFAHPGYDQRLELVPPDAPPAGATSGKMAPPTAPVAPATPAVAVPPAPRTPARTPAQAQRNVKAAGPPQPISRQELAAKLRAIADRWAAPEHRARLAGAFGQALRDHLGEADALKLAQKVLPKVQGRFPFADKESAIQAIEKGLAGKAAAAAQKAAPVSTLSDPADRTDHAPGTVAPIRTDLVHADPERFQYKLGVTNLQTGASGSTADAKVWNPELAGVVQVWKDPADGKVYVVNGHNRYDLARRLGVGTLNAMYIDARDDVEARAKGALTNIAEGRGTATDAAKFFRGDGSPERKITRADLEARGVQLKDAIAARGLALAGLASPLFSKVIDGQLTEAQGAILGGAGLPEPTQVELAKLAEEDGYTDEQLREAVDEAVGAHEDRTHQPGLAFDQDLTPEEEEQLRNETRQRHRLKAHVRKELTRTKNLFGNVADSGKVRRLTEAGNVLDEAKNKQISQEAAAASFLFSQTANRKGPLATLLAQQARRMAGARNDAERNGIRQETVQQVIAQAPEWLNAGLEDQPKRLRDEGPTMFGRRGEGRNLVRFRRGLGRLRSRRLVAVAEGA